MKPLVSDSRRVRRLIVHADDLGLAHSVNEATFMALQEGVVSSASVMVPCPNFREAANFASRNPKIDVGIHLTLTSEWPRYRWGPVAPRSAVSSLIDATGCFFSNVANLVRQADMTHVEIELRAQIELAMNSGITPTHLDSHMYALFALPAGHSLLRRIAREYGLLTPMFPHKAKQLPGTEPSLQRLYEIMPTASAERWVAEYQHIVDCLPDGVSVLVVHLGKDDDELKLITDGIWQWGARWRALDDMALRSASFRDALRRNEVQICRWSDVGIPVE